MRPARLSVIALVGLVACTTREARRDTSAPATATLAGTPTSDVAAVRQVIDSMNTRIAKAILQGDTVAQAAVYTDDAIVMSGGVPAARGRDAIVKEIGRLNASMKLSSFTIRTEDVIVAAEYAIETGKYELAGLRPKSAKPVHQVGKYLIVWKKQGDGTYKIVRDISNNDSAP